MKCGTICCHVITYKQATHVDLQKVSAEVFREAENLGRNKFVDHENEVSAAFRDASA